MSVSASTIRLLVDAGMGTDELILVADACERGPDYRMITIAIEAMQAHGAPAAAIADAVVEMAQEMVKANAAKARWFAQPKPRDEHTVKRDSNRSRRNMPDRDWRELRAKVFERDEWVCQYCGSEENLTCDHVLPLVRGGNNDEDNLTTACRSCNSSKGDKLLEEWVRVY